MDNITLKRFTEFRNHVLLICALFITTCLIAQKSGTWSAQGSGASTTWTSTAGDILISASATGYGSGTGYTMNDFVTSDSMGCNNSAYSESSIVGNPSLSIRHTFPNTAQLTFTFSKAVEDPVMHFDRLGGGQVSNLTSSSLITILTPGITFTELSGNGSHFVTTSTTVGRQAGQTYTSLPSECGPPLAGTASGSVRLNGVFSSITFQISMDAVGSTSSINDRWEIAFSEIQSLTLDFDGIDDYISRAPFFGGMSEVTMMTWIKLDAGSDGGEIMGQRNFRLFVNANKKLKIYAKTDSGLVSSVVSAQSSSPDLQDNLWYHVAAVYNGNSGDLSMLLNGEVIWSRDDLTGSMLDNLAAWNSDYDFEIGRNSYSQNGYFEGSIYETRVFNKALTLDQIKQQVHQEIENNSGLIRGTVIPKDIEGLTWSDLILYYKMDILDSGQTTDNSNMSINGNLHEMRTYQEYTAPLPFITKTGGTGNWKDEDNWLHGDIWSIDEGHSSAAIIVLTESLLTNEDHEMVGLIIENGKKLDVTQDSGLINSWYLKLDGDIDLQGESQLVQLQDSELDITSSGSLERDQQGTKDRYTYNYWASPVGVSNTTSNNNSYALSDVFRDGTDPLSPLNINFITNGYDGTASSPIGIADYWVWKFANLPSGDYSSWQQVRSSGSVNTGEGFTLKGTANTNGNVSLEQNYVFIGKPNNGDIELDLEANNDYLIGNPYPSAIDAEQFILDNGPTIEGTGNTTGTLYFWEHWGGGSHVLQEYQGGYALYNLSGATVAASKADINQDVDQNGVLVGTKLPGRYIPVGQGFFVVGENTGKIKFNNGQRIFVTEDSNASNFMRNSQDDSSYVEDSSVENEDDRMKIRLGFNSISTIHRQLLVTVDTRATLDYDWGFDGELNLEQIDDMYWMIDDKKYIIQGINEIIESETVLPLGIKTNIDGSNLITIDDLENVPNSLPIYLHDVQDGVYHDLRVSDYEVFLTAGEYLDRFELVFENQEETLGVINSELDNGLNYYYAVNREKIVILNPTNLEFEHIEIFSSLGQSVQKIEEIWHSPYSEYKINNLSSGTYIVKLKSSQNKTYTKKIIVK